MAVTGGFNQQIRLLESLSNLTTVIGTLTYNADKFDNARLRRFGCGIWYVKIENLVNTPVITVKIENMVFGGTTPFACIGVGGAGVAHTSGEGDVEAYGVGFAFTNDGDYKTTNQSKGRIHAGYRISVIMTGAGAEADISIEAHYGYETGG